MSAEQAAAHAPTAGEYIQHHLQHLQLNFAFEPVKQTKLVDFSLFNADSIFYSVVLGALVCLILWAAARKATAGVPGRFQALVEILVEFVDTQARGLIHNKSSLKVVSPIALTVFLWIFFMNAMDMLPVDCRGCGVRHMRQQQGMMRRMLICVWCRRQTFRLRWVCRFPCC